MTYWDKNPNVFKYIIAIASLLAVSHIVLVFYLLITSTTDDNLYTQLNDFNYNTKPIIGINLDNGTNKLDTIKPGHVLLAINDSSFAPPNYEYNDYLEQITPNSTVKLKFLNLQVRKPITIEVKKSDIPERFTVFVPMSAWVNSVTEGGASDRAGLKQGDLIIRVNGKSFKDIFEADRLMRRLGSGNEILYEVLRFEKKFEVKVALSKIGISWYSLVSLTTSVLTLILGFWIGFNKPNLVAGRMISISIIFVGMLLFHLFVRVPHDQILLSEVGFFVTNFVLIFSTPLFFHTALYFPSEKPQIIKKQKPILVGYLMAAILFSLASILYFLHIKSYMPYLFMYGVTAILLYFVVLFIWNRKHFKKEEKRKSLFIRIIIFAVSSFMIFDLIIQNYNLMSREYVTTVVEFLPLVIFMIPIGIAYTIWRYRLLDFDFKFRRNIIFAFALTLVNGMFILVLAAVIFFITGIDIKVPEIVFTGTAIEVLGDNEIGSNSKRIEFFILLGASVIAFFGVYQLRLNTSIWLNKKFDRQTINYKSVYSQVFESIEPSSGVETIADTFMENLDRVIGFKRFGIIIYGTDQLIRYQNYGGFEGLELENFNKSLSRRFTFYLKEFNGVFSTDYLPDGIKEVYYKYEIENLVPIKTRDQFNGVILLGEKLSETGLTHDEIDLLKSIANQASVTINNSLLYEKLTQQERIRHELEFARQIQTASLPSKAPDIDGFDIFGDSIPALEVGGDFYDYLPSKDGKSHTFIIGDVSGKGTSAALYMSKIQGVIRTLNVFDLSPRNLMIYANTQLHKKIDKSFFVTALTAKLSTSDMTLRIVRAGHNPLLYFDSITGKTELIKPIGMGLGLTDSETFASNLEEYHRKITKGDIILLYTDGITDSRNHENDDYGDERLASVLQSTSHLSTLEIKDAIFDDIRNYTNETMQFDDMTLLIVKIL
ncbi:MAG: SpoIIE family protein phosphatase [Desulfobulbaceae bacterium]|nr:SpoIIE family protein phosphatase [Desulfobulbaceae bacterium]